MPKDKKITKTIVEQLIKIRNTGETNMFKSNKVAEIANREGYYQLFNHIYDYDRNRVDRAAYMELMQTDPQDFEIDEEKL